MSRFDLLSEHDRLRGTILPQSQTLIY